MSEHGVTVAESVASVIDNLSAKGESDFLKGWWLVQKRLHETEFSNRRRYPPSVVKYVTVTRQHILITVTVIPGVSDFV